MFGLILDAFIALSPLIGYYSQYDLIKKNKSLGTFSIDICGILLIANILRIFFWLTQGFAINLLLQSFFVIGIQIVILEQCIFIIKKNSETETNIKLDGSFWRWQKVQSYLYFLAAFFGVLLFLTIFVKFTFIPFYGQFVGLLSMSIQSTLGFPQLYSNWKTKSVQGLSFFMIFTWFLGDFFKTLYFIAQIQPFQFIMCGTIQLTVDILIILQIIKYSQFDILSFIPVKNNKYEEIQPQNEKL